MEGSGRVPATSHKGPFLPEGELVELLWQNGGVVVQAQTHQRSSGGALADTSGVTGEETAAWFPDGGDALGKDLYSQLWHSIANGDGDGGRGAVAHEHALPPARSRAGLSFCGSNLVPDPAPAAKDDIDDAAVPTPPEEEPGNRAGASSSGGSGSCALFKRVRDELDSRSEGADFEAVDKTPPSKRPATKRRTRAAEVHNLSERRRRDRINEKMRALQELVPHCTKTDKASVLDDAIEYLKSLQFQLQIMWMTPGIAPMMFPAAHQLMPPMSMGLNRAYNMNNPLSIQMPQIPSPAINAPDVPSKMHNDNRICEPRNPSLHPNDTFTATAQVQGLFPYGFQTAQHNEIHEELLASAVMPSSP
ncbi:hypothetical protein ABZP36_000450 [Zizania latifolia]